MEYKHKRGKNLDFYSKFVPTKNKMLQYLYIHKFIINITSSDKYCGYQEIKNLYNLLSFIKIK